MLFVVTLMVIFQQGSTTARDRIEFADRTERITRKKHHYLLIFKSVNDLTD